MPALWIVEQFDVIEHILAGVLANFVDLSPDPFGLEGGEESLGYGIIVTDPSPAHAGFQIVVFQEVLRELAGKL